MGCISQEQLTDNEMMDVRSGYGFGYGEFLGIEASSADQLPQGASVVSAHRQRKSETATI
jgi:hypothetical protein